MIPTMTETENEINSRLKDLNKHLGTVISLLLRMIPKDGKSINLKEQISILDGLGVRPRDIAEMLNRSQGYISKELAGIRKGKKK